MDHDDQPPRTGFRKDGQPYVTNNTREDGSYAVGKNRPDPKHQFRKGDDRKRGRRAKGTKNLATEWNEELMVKGVVTEAGVKKKITKRRMLIKTQIDRGIKSSDRAAETAFRYAELSERREPTLQADDIDIIQGFLAGYTRNGDSYDNDDGHGPGQSTLDEGDGVTGDA